MSNSQFCLVEKFLFYKCNLISPLQGFLGIDRYEKHRALPCAIDSAPLKLMIYNVFLQRFLIRFPAFVFIGKSSFFRIFRFVNSSSYDDEIGVKGFEYVLRRVVLLSFSVP